MATPTQAQLEAALTAAEIDFQKLHAIVQGASDDPDVTTEGGNVPTVANRIAALTTIIATAAADAAAAATAKDNAETAEGNAEAAKTAAEAAQAAAEAADAAVQAIAAAITEDVTNAILDALKGAAANPVRIGKEYMPEELEIHSVEFADGSELTLDDGQFTGGTDDRLYRHNGNDLGGIPYAPLPRGTYKGLTSIPVARAANRVSNLACAGTVLTDGDMEFVITSALVTGSPLTVTVPVLAGDRAQEWNKKAAAVLNVDAAVSPHYKFYTCAGILQMQEVVQTASEVFTVRSHNGAGTVTGITDKTSSQSQQFAFISLAEFGIKASEMVDGNKFYATGRVDILLQSTSTSASSYYLSFYTGGDHTSILNTSSVCSYANLLPDSTGKLQNQVFLNAPAKLKSSSGLLSMSLLNTDTVTGTYQGVYLQREVSTGTLVAKDLVFSHNAGKGVAGVDNDLVLALVFRIASTNGAGYVGVDMNFSNLSTW